jgi:hypothetical protein
MAIVEFIILSLLSMYIGRRLGWALSRGVFYTVPMAISIMLCVLWGVGVAGLMRILLNWQQPGTVLRWLMGHALAAYVAIPNYGLLDQSSIPQYAVLRHNMISVIPSLSYIVAAVIFAFVFPY